MVLSKLSSCLERLPNPIDDEIYDIFKKELLSGDDIRLSRKYDTMEKKRYIG